MTTLLDIQVVSGPLKGRTIAMSPAAVYKRLPHWEPCGELSSVHPIFDEYRLRVQDDQLVYVWYRPVLAEVLNPGA